MVNAFVSPQGAAMAINVEYFENLYVWGIDLSGCVIPRSRYGHKGGIPWKFKTNNIWNLCYYCNRTHSIVPCIYTYVENPRREIFHRRLEVSNSCCKKFSCDFLRHGTKHNCKRKLPENGDHPHLRPLVCCEYRENMQYIIRKRRDFFTDEYYNKYISTCIEWWMVISIWFWQRLWVCVLNDYHELYRIGGNVKKHMPSH